MQRLPQEVSTPHAAALAWGFLILTWVSVLALGLLQYWMPPDYWPAWGVNYPSVRQFAQAFGISVAPLPSSTFSLVFVSFASLAFLAYISVIALVIRARLQANRTVVFAYSVFLVGFATVVPAGLSTDVYAYLAYGRMLAEYSLNPHIHSAFEILRFGDPVGPFLWWDMPSPYGPVWTFFSFLIASMTPTESVWIQILAFKWLAAFAALFLSLGIAKLANAYCEEKSAAAFWAAIACPLIVLEGPGNGHNDVLMMAFFVWALVLLRTKNGWPGSLMLAFSATIKFVPLVAIPWVYWARQNLGLSTWSKAFAQAFIVVLSVLLVTIAVHFGAPASPQVQGLFARIGASALFVAVAYLALTLWILREPFARSGVAWVYLTASLIVLIGPPYPWYFVWPLALAVTQWNPSARLAFALVFLLSFLSILGYAIVPSAA